MKICERNSSNGTDSLPLRNQGIGISMAELLGFPVFILIHHFWVIFISGAACGTFAQSFGSAFSRCEIGRLTDFLVTYVFTDVRHGVTVSQVSFSLGDLPKVRYSRRTGGGRSRKCCN